MLKCRDNRLKPGSDLIVMDFSALFLSIMKKLWPRFLSYSRWDLLLIPWRLQKLQGWCLFHKSDLINYVGMADRGGFDRGFGGRGGRGDRGRGDRGRGRGRPRGGRKDDEEKWVPCTKLGRLVQAVRPSWIFKCDTRRVIRRASNIHQADWDDKCGCAV